MQNLIAKTAGVVVAIALFVGVAVPAANALTSSELVELLISLGIISGENADAARTALGDNNTTTTSNTGVCSITRDLTIGATGADVVTLQDTLIANNFLVIPAGVSKGYFGSLTQSALAQMQAAEGISPPAGYFGPITRSAFAGLCAASNNSSDDDSDDDMDDDNDSGLQGGAGDITVTERSSGVKDEVLEGEEEVKVLGFEIEADGSDIEITSVKVEFEHMGSGSDRLNRYVDEVLIMNGNDVVGSADVDDFNEDSDVYSESIRLSDVVIDEDDDTKLYVAVSAVNNVDSDDLGKDWDVTLVSTRYEDGDGAILTDSTESITETFTFEDLSSTGDIELTVREDDETINDARTEQVDDTSDTNGVEILSFEIEAEGSDLYLNDLFFNATSTGAGVTEIANDFVLYMDGEEVGNLSGSTASSTDPTRTLTFVDLDDDDVVVDEGDTVTFILEADINDIDGGFQNGATLVVSLNADDVDADDENGDTVTDLTGSAESQELTFVSTGVMLGKGDSDTSSVVLNLDTTSTDDEGKFSIFFNVTAFEDPAYIDLTATTTDTTTGAAGVYAYVESTNANDDIVSTGTTTATLERVSGGTLSGNYVKINAGQTVKLKATVYHDPAATGTYRAQLGQVNFASSAEEGTDSQSAVPSSDYQSPSEKVNN